MFAQSRVNMKNVSIKSSLQIAIEKVSPEYVEYISSLSSELIPHLSENYIDTAIIIEKSPDGNIPTFEDCNMLAQQANISLRYLYIDHRLEKTLTNIWHYPDEDGRIYAMACSH